jgi:hypothetical protein
MATITKKLWVGMGVFVLAGSQVELTNERILEVGMVKAWAAGQGGEGGEGGEAGAKAAGSKKKRTANERKADFLKNLTLVEGHLIAGHELYKANVQDAAKTHMKHPRSELYSKLAPGFKEFGVPPFDATLQKMVSAVAQGQSFAEVDRAHQNVAADIERARGKVQLNTKTRLLALAQVVREAGVEYGEGVKEGKIANAHEYQDAYGFVKAGLRLLDAAPPSAPAEKEAVEQARRVLLNLSESWPSLISEGPVKLNASEIYGAVSQIELAASSLKP